MKKILAVLIAISMVATMAFAADINASATVKAAGNVVTVSDLSKAVDTATLLNETQDGNVVWGGAKAGYSFGLTVATADEKAGADITINDMTGLGNDNVVDLGASLWIKPIDQVKLTFMDADLKLASDTSFTWGSVQKTDGDYGVTVTPIDGLTVDFVTVKDIKKNSHPLLAGKVAYKLDGVATFSAVANDDEKFGFAIDGVSVGPVSANAWFTSEAAKYTVYESATVAVASVTFTEAAKVVDFDAPAIPVYLKAAATVADVAVACEASWDDIKKDAGKLSVKPSATISGACGAAGWSMGVELPVAIADETVVSLNVPYTVSMAW